MNENQRLLMGLFESSVNENEMHSMIEADVDEAQLGAMVATILDYAFKNELNMDTVFQYAGIVLENTDVAIDVDDVNMSQMN